MTSLAELLTRPDIWRGDAIAVSPAPTLPSGFAQLDAELPGGGWPRSQLIELLHDQAGIGELSLLLPALAQLTAQGGKVVLVLPESFSNRVPHAPAWAAAGVNIEHLYWVWAQRERDCLWAAVESLRCGAVAATLLWCDPSMSLVINSFRRLHVAAGEGQGCGFVYRPLRDAAVTSPAPLRLRLRATDELLQVDLLKRRGHPLAQPLRLAVPRPAAWRGNSDALAGAVPQSQVSSGLPVGALA